MPGSFYADLVLGRRGGSDTATDTTDASSYPTTPPASTHTHFQSIPEIDGSEGGFIGLVVGLGVIFVGSCIGVFFLLRNWTHGGRTVRGKSGEVGVEAPPAGPGFPARRGTLFGFRPQNHRKAGWVRAPGEDADEWDWDATDDLGAGPYRARGHAAHGTASVQRGRGAYAGSGAGGAGAHDGGVLHAAGEAGLNRASSVSSVQLQALGGGLHGSRPFHDPFAPSVRTTSPSQRDDETVVNHPVDATRDKDLLRQSSLDSAETVVTLPGGTKFKEDL